MTAEELMKRITAYYGPYKQAFCGKTTLEYAREYTDAERDEVWRRLIRNVSTEYGAVPDVAVLHRLGMEARREVKPPALPEPSDEYMDREEAAARLGEISKGMLDPELRRAHEKLRGGI